MKAKNSGKCKQDLLTPFERSTKEYNEKASKREKEKNATHIN